MMIPKIITCCNVAFTNIETETFPTSGLQLSVVFKKVKGTWQKLTKLFKVSKA